MAYIADLNDTTHGMQNDRPYASFLVKPKAQNGTSIRVIHVIGTSSSSVNPTSAINLLYVYIFTSLVLFLVLLFLLLFIIRRLKKAPKNVPEVVVVRSLKSDEEEVSFKDDFVVKNLAPNLNTENLRKVKIKTMAVTVRNNIEDGTEV